MSATRVRQPAPEDRLSKCRGPDVRRAFSRDTAPTKFGVPPRDIALQVPRLFLFFCRHVALAPVPPRGLDDSVSQGPATHAATMSVNKSVCVHWSTSPGSPCQVRLSGDERSLTPLLTHCAVWYSMQGGILRTRALALSFSLPPSLSLFPPSLSLHPDETLRHTDTHKLPHLQKDNVWVVFGHATTSAPCEVGTAQSGQQAYMLTWPSAD